MRGTIRLALAVALVALASLALVPPFWLAVRTGLFPSAPLSRLWHRAVLRALGWRVRVEGGLAAERPLLVVGNHVSWSDIVVLGAQADLGFVAKAELASWPLLGWLARLENTVFVERERKRRSGEQAQHLGHWLRRGRAMVLFAEGSTADGNLVMPFKSTLFGALPLAAAVGEDGTASGPIAVQPAAIVYTRLHGVPMGRWERNVASWIGERSLGEHLRILHRHGPLDVVLVWGEPMVFDRPPPRKELARRTEAAVRRIVAERLRG